ncbi:hypothetical protein QFZ34_003124 [Phyllobacterium ifriqiyense]|uniref:Uncharacterized protein n=1 Tax=Phyllobacterium ifriqiyense TaxID=314238 RepID=A0ABU0SB15_9HYPH|nr:hypothetical protein [Phyllobacterium ifriqiyense]
MAGKSFAAGSANVTDQSITIESDQATYGDKPAVEVPFEMIADARLILTDDLIRDALRRDKDLREGRIPEDNSSDTDEANASDEEQS